MIYFQPGPSHILEIAAIPRLKRWLAEGEFVIVHAEADCFSNTNLQNLKCLYGSRVIFWSYPKKNRIMKYLTIGNQIKRILKEYDITKSYLHNHCYYENRLFIDMYFKKKASDSIIYIAHALKQHMDVTLDFHMRKLDYLNKDATGKFFRQIKRYCIVNLDIFFSEYFFPFLYTFHFLRSDINFRNGKRKCFSSEKYNLQFLCYTEWDEKCFRHQAINNIVRTDHPLSKHDMQGMKREKLDVAFFFTRGMVQYFMDAGYSVSHSVEKYFVEEIKLLKEVVSGVKIGIRLHPNEFYTNEIVSAINSYFDDVIFLNDESHTTLVAINSAVVIVTDGCSVGYVAGVMKKPLVIAIDHHKIPSFSESIYYDGVTYSDSVTSTIRYYSRIPKIIEQFTNS